jgi:ABC-type multidrug transport system fused ATPase/permease subunit
MLLLVLFTSTLEVFGIGMVGPFMALATNPDAISENQALATVYAVLPLKSESQFLMLLGLILILTFFVKAFLNFRNQKQIFNFGFRLQGELARRLMHAYLNAPYTYHLSKNSTIIVQNIVSETERFANNFVMPLLTFISNGIVTVLIVGLLVATNAMATIIIAGVLLIAIVILNVLKDRPKKWGKRVYEAKIGMHRQINHGLGGLKEAKVIGCEGYFEQKLQEHAEDFGRNAALAASFSNLPRYVIEAFLITFLIIFTFIFLATNQGNTQNLTGVLGIFSLASIRLLPIAGGMVSTINSLKFNIHSLNQIYFDLKELEQEKTCQLSGASQRSHLWPDTPDKSRLTNQITSPYQIVLENIVYRYPNASKDALRGISLAIHKGESIGLIGKSGAGKTTLVDVILGLLIPQGGDIKVDGMSIYQNLRSWQDLVGYVPQSIFLIDDTLERNIAYGVPDYLIDAERVHLAVESAQLSDLVEQLPQGLQTVIGERGVMLSGGQRQRVGIARALYHEREVLVFDEATAALDNETEGLVTEAIKSLGNTKTIIIIAHRLSTIEHCDRIYLLENGRAIKSGSYQEVVLSQ